MGAFTILTGKEGNNPKRPLFLVQITAVDGDTVYLTTAASLGASTFTYSGNTYLSRLAKNDIDALQSVGAQGFGNVPGFRLSIADGDKTIWLNHCLPHGWRGATVTLTVILWDVAANAVSSDAQQWTFLSGCAQHANGTTTVDVVSALNFARIRVPTVAVQFRCPWSFPPSAAARADGLNNPLSPYYQCGYSADISGGYGNLQGDGTPFTTCDYTRSSSSDPSVGCMARLGNASDTSISTDGNLLLDKAGNHTGNFGGFTWIAPAQYQGRQYTSGQKTFGFNQPNPSIVGSYANWVSGTQFVTGLLLAPAGDPNSLRSEVLGCFAPFGAATVQKVIVAGVEIPLGGSDVLFTARIITAGGRHGAINRDNIFNSANTVSADPHGNFLIVEFVVPAELSAPGSVPACQLLITGPPEISFNADTSVSYVSPQLQDGAALPASNAVWSILTALAFHLNVPISQFDPVSWYQSGTKAAVTTTYTAADGSTQTHALYKSCWSIGGQNQQPLSQLMPALANASNLIIDANSLTSKIQCFVKETLADQQPAPIPGSNDSTGRLSLTAADTVATGYYAYAFNPSNITAGSFKTTALPFDSIPNLVGVGFQDEYNGYQQDSLTEIDPDSFAYSGNQKVQAPAPLMGGPNFDQLSRAANVILAEALYGNPRNDAGATLYFEFKCNHRVMHLTGRLGYICGLFWPTDGIGTSSNPQAIRIISLQPDTDGESWSIKAAWHNDAWYTTAYGQNPTPFHANPLNNPPARKPYPYSPRSGIIGAAVNYSQAADGSAIATITVNGTLTANQLSALKPPSVPLQGTAGTGGSLTGGLTWYIGLCSVDSNGLYSQMSALVKIVVPTGGNSATVPNITWPGGAVSYAAFIGLDELGMRAASLGAISGTPASVTISAYTPNIYGPPDLNTTRYRLRVKPEIHAGYFGAACTSITDSGGTSTIIGFSSATFTPGQWVGYTMRRTGSVGADQTFPELEVTANDAVSITVASGGGLSTIAQAGDVWIPRAMAMGGSASCTSSSITDPNWVNCFSTGLTAEAGNVLRIIKGTGQGQTYTLAPCTTTQVNISGTFRQALEATTQYVIEGPSWLAGFGDGVAFQNSAPNTTTIVPLASAIVPNVAAQYVVQVLSEDSAGNLAIPHRSPTFDMFLFGNAGSGSGGSAFSVAISHP